METREEESSREENKEEEQIGERERESRSCEMEKPDLTVNCQPSNFNWQISGQHYNENINFQGECVCGNE